MSLVRNTALSAAAALVVSIGRLVANAYFARHLAVTDYGAFVLVQWVIDITFLIASFGVTAAASRFFAHFSVEQASGSQEFERWFRGRSLITAAIVSVVAPLGAFATRGGTSLIEGLSTVLWALGNAGWMLTISEAQGRQQFHSVLISNIAFVLALWAGAVEFTGRLGVTGSVMAMACATVTASLAGALTITRVNGMAPAGARFDKAAIQQYALNSWVSSLVAGLVWARAEMPIVRARLGTEDVANYGVALTCAGIVNSAISLVTGALAPRLAQLWATRDVERYTALCRAATDIIAVLSATAIGFTALFSEEIVHIVFGKQYHTAVGATAILALGAFGLTSSAAAALAQYQSNGTFARNANVMGAIILLTLSLILVWPLGLIGVAASRALAQLVVAGLAFFSAARSTSGPLAFSPLTLLSTAAVLTLLVIIILFGAHLEVRLTIFCAFIACVIWRSGALASRAKELMKIISPTST